MTTQEANKLTKRELISKAFYLTKGGDFTRSTKKDIITLLVKKNLITK